ncbi:MAG: hypothetical protein WKF81_08725 [Thermomicrobiales bacterium]
MMRRFLRLVIVLLMLATLQISALQLPALAQPDDLDCDDFTNQDAAQIVLDADDSYADALDEDGDGEACPDLPPRDDDSEVEFELTLGYPRVTFEEEFGEATDVDDAEE